MAAAGIPSITFGLAGHCGRRMSHATVKTVRPLQITSAAIAIGAMGACESVSTSSRLPAARPSYTGPLLGDPQLVSPRWLARSRLALRDDLIAFLLCDSADIIAELLVRNPGIGDLLADLEADDDLRARLEIERLEARG
ncbi:MAG TPA: hypothetical protein VFI59_02240 [Actinomycetota bacterium]|nr:hypothetical protein [Actinomycetota bacterium]